VNAADDALVGALEAASTVVYDFDGVLADSEPLHLRSYRELVADMGGTLDEDGFRSLIGRKEREIWPAVLGRPADLDELVDRRAEAFLASAEVELELNPRVAWMLRCGYAERVLLSSGNPRIVERMLEVWSVRKLFSEVHALGDSPLTKAEELRRIADVRMSAGPWRGVLVEDSPALIDVGSALGLTTVGVVHSLNTRADVESADFVIERST
jgi:beta-phosphoglucomutase-like phosphatase (HAD superfamily)